MKTVLFNPYTGRPRHPLDIQSDPQGLAIVDPEAPLLAAKDDTPPPDLSDAMHASAAAGCGCADCAFDREPCLTCYAAWWRKRHPNIVLAGGEFDNDPLGVRVPGEGQ